MPLGIARLEPLEVNAGALRPPAQDALLHVPLLLAVLVGGFRLIDRRSFIKLLGGVTALVIPARGRAVSLDPLDPPGRLTATEVKIRAAQKIVDPPLVMDGQYGRGIADLVLSDPYAAYQRAIGEALSAKLDREMAHCQGFHDWQEKG